MKSTYIVLRDRNRPRGRRPSIYSGSPGDSVEPRFNIEEVFRDAVQSDVAQEASPDPTLEVLEADPKHVAELALDEDADAVAREMPVSLIQPMDTGEVPSCDADTNATWGIQAIGADRSKFVGASAKVAVLDSGIRSDHVAFQTPQLTIVGKDFTGKGDIGDESGHGTHCSSIIVGRDVRGRRIGVAPGVRTLLVGRIFAPGVTTTSTMVVRAVQWAVDNGSNVISMSLAFNFTGLSAELHDGGLPIEAATAQALVEFQNNLRLFDRLMDMFRAKENFPDDLGVVIVGAAGNHSHRLSKSGEPVFTVPVAAPSNAFGITSVGALRRTESGLGIASFSNSAPTLVAPGFEILAADSQAADNDMLTYKNGTSMACPHVAGLAALWWDAIRQSGSVIKAQTVVSNIRASCKTKPLSFGLNADDRGLGLPHAP